MTRFWLAGVCVASFYGSAQADETFFSAEAPASMAVSDAQEGLFRPGAMPAVGAYAGKPAGSLDLVAIGVRLRAGLLRNGPAPMEGSNFKDPGTGGLGTLGLAVRVVEHGFWVEGVVGGGVTGKDKVPALEAGVGYLLDVGKISVGPSVRYMRLVGGNSPGLLGSADLVLAGIDVRFGTKSHDKRAKYETFVAQAPVDRTPVVVGPVADDHDAVADAAAEPSCADDAEGCPLGDDVFLKDGRIVLDERVLFDFGRAHVHARGREAIQAIASAWKSHPEWKHVVIEGHCDVRGNDEYNQWLSELRAGRARDVLLKAGFAADQVTAIGYGRTRPRDEGTTEAAHQRNRRVEFVIETQVEVHQPRTASAPADPAATGGAKSFAALAPTK